MALSEKPLFLWSLRINDKLTDSAFSSMGDVSGTLEESGGFPCE